MAKRKNTKAAKPRKRTRKTTKDMAEVIRHKMAADPALAEAVNAELVTPQDAVVIMPPAAEEVQVTPINAGGDLLMFGGTETTQKVVDNAVSPSATPTPYDLADQAMKNGADKIDSAYDNTPLWWIALGMAILVGLLVLVNSCGQAKGDEILVDLGAATGGISVDVGGKDVDVKWGWWHRPPAHRPHFAPLPKHHMPPHHRPAPRLWQHREYGGN